VGDAVSNRGTIGGTLTNALGNYRRRLSHLRVRLFLVTVDNGDPYSLILKGKGYKRSNGRKQKTGKAKTTINT